MGREQTWLWDNSRVFETHECFVVSMGRLFGVFLSLAKRGHSGGSTKAHCWAHEMSECLELLGCEPIFGAQRRVFLEVLDTNAIIILQVVLDWPRDNQQSHFS